ncbi:MAG: OB-fold nucleic acid binding domain-containing protein, partial [Bacteroidales bacterium]|nr:OB-fold nucleic acid binding domain-containing protein [Bacteroidales bacterium]
MQVNLIDTKIEFLKGVGEKKAKVLNKELGITTYRDLISYYPYRYVDKSNFVQIKDIQSEEVFIQIRGKVIGMEIIGIGAKARLSVNFADQTGKVELVFFKGIKWIKESIKQGKEYVIFGKPSLFKGTYNFAHPDIEPLETYLASQENLTQKFSPLYNTSEKMKNAFLNSKAISNLMRVLIGQVKGYIAESLPKYIIDNYHLISLEEALIQIHFPSSTELLSKAKARLKFEELFFMQLEHQLLKTIRVEKSQGLIFSMVGNVFNDFFNNYLPFPLTNAQKRVIKEIRNDMRTGHQMNRLLQGDVGSGKTLVALLSMLI